MTVEDRESLHQLYLQCRKDYDATCNAIRYAKVHEHPIVSELITEKFSVNKARQDLEAQILQGMEDSSNLEHLGEGWYAIRVRVDKSTLGLMVEPLVETELSLVEQDETTGRSKSRAEVESILPAIKNEPLLELYKVDIEERTREILHQHGVEVDDPEEIGRINGVVWSSHARKRYAQRFLGISSESQADQYQRTHVHEIESDLYRIYERAEHVWSSSDGVEYHFEDENNIMFVVGRYNKVVTLYEEDFGFTKDINRSIVYQQLEVISKARDELDEVREANVTSVQAIDDRTQEVNLQIDLVNAELDALKAERSALSANRVAITKKMSEAEKRFLLESSKLFKKWEGVEYDHR